MSFEIANCLYEQIKLPAESEFYQKALEEMEEDGVSSQIYYLLQKQGKLADTPLFFQKQLKESYSQVFYQNLLIRNQTDQLLGEFANLEIDVIALKGVYFAQKYFGHFAARPTSDIDLLIREADIDKAVDCVKKLGYTTEEERISGHFHCSFSKKLSDSPKPLVVEIHWDIVKQETAKLDIHEFWQTALQTEKSRHIKELSPYHSFYMIILHGWRHNLDSLKYFLDIIEMIHRLKDEVNYEKLLSDARAHQTYKRIVRTMTIVYQQFPHLENIKEFPYKKARVYWKYRSAKNIKKYIDFIDYQFLSYDSFRHCLIEWFHWNFPSKSDVIVQLEGDRYKKNPFNNYLFLFKKRLVNLLKAVLSHEMK